MTHHSSPAAWPVAVLLALSGLQSVSAELSVLSKPPWAGHFVVFENRNFRFSVTNQGEMTLTPMNPKGEPMGESSSVVIDFVVEELLSDGKSRIKKIKSGSLESSDPATDKLRKALIRGKVTGDASYEVTIEQDRGVIFIGGRITDAGALKKYPLRCAVYAKIPNLYDHVDKVGKAEQRAFEKMIRDNRLDLIRKDGKRLRQAFIKPVDVRSAEINGPGIAEAEIEISSYHGKKVLFSASENSAITLYNDRTAPLYEGFSLCWVPDAAKDTEGKSRFGFRVK